MTRYNKFWVALLQAAITLAVIMFPDSGLAVPDEESLKETVVIITNILGAGMVWAVPNKE